MVGCQPCQDPRSLEDLVGFALVEGLVPAIITTC